MLVLVRIDDRLIHGQVVEGWVNHLKATCLVVADDRVAASAFQRSVMELSVPRGLSVLIGGIDEVCAKVSSGALDGERVILLFSNPADVVRALRTGLACGALNIGGMRFVPGKRKLLDVLAVDEGDLGALREISARGVAVEVQTVPTGRSVPLQKVLQACAPAGSG